MRSVSESLVGGDGCRFQSAPILSLFCWRGSAIIVGEYLPTSHQGFDAEVVNLLWVPPASYGLHPCHFQIQRVPLLFFLFTWKPPAAAGVLGRYYLLYHQKQWRIQSNVHWSGSGGFSRNLGCPILLLQDQEVGESTFLLRLQDE